MRTYYSGPDAVVTDELLTVPRTRKSFALRDLDADQLRISREADFFGTASVVFGIVGGTGLLGCVGSTLGIMWHNWWIGLGAVVIAAVLFLATYIPFVVSRDDTVYVLRGVHRGAQEILYTSPSEAKVFRIWYALREALEDGTG